jgi:tyrosinase
VKYYLFKTRQRQLNMRVDALLFAILGAAAAVSNCTCKEPAVRKEWRQLSEESRQSYLQAVLCLRSKPSRLGLETSLYEDFPYVHARVDTESNSPSLLLHRSQFV